MLHQSALRADTQVTAIATTWAVYSKVDGSGEPSDRDTVLIRTEGTLCADDKWFVTPSHRVRERAGRLSIAPRDFGWRIMPRDTDVVLTCTYTRFPLGAVGPVSRLGAFANAEHAEQLSAIVPMELWRGDAPAVFDGFAAWAQACAKREMGRPITDGPIRGNAQRVTSPLAQRLGQALTGQRLAQAPVFLRCCDLGAQDTTSALTATLATLSGEDRVALPMCGGWIQELPGFDLQFQTARNTTANRLEASIALAELYTQTQPNADMSMTDMIDKARTVCQRHCGAQPASRLQADVLVLEAVLQATSCDHPLSEQAWDWAKGLLAHQLLSAPLLPNSIVQLLQELRFVPAALADLMADADPRLGRAVVRNMVHLAHASRNETDFDALAHRMICVRDPGRSAWHLTVRSPVHVQSYLDDMAGATRALPPLLQDEVSRVEHAVQRSLREVAA